MRSQVFRYILMSGTDMQGKNFSQFIKKVAFILDNFHVQGESLGQQGNGKNLKNGIRRILRLRRMNYYHHLYMSGENLGENILLDIW